MNNERYNQIIDEVYNDYKKTTPEQYVVGSDSDPMKQSMIWKRKTDSLSGYPILERLSQEEFINKIKTDSEFSEKWGLKIEERKLSLKEEAEAYNIMLEKQNYNPKWQSKIEDIDKLSDKELMTILQSLPGPSKLITITYKNETVEIYE